MTRRRYRLRSLLIITTALVLAAGAIRLWFDKRFREYEQVKRVADELALIDASFSWSYNGLRRFESWELPYERAFWRPTAAYFDDVTSADFNSKAPQLTRLVGLESLYVLGRQIVPHARAARSGKADAVIEALRRHPTLRQVVVDVSIRGTPAEFDAPIYTREDWALLEKVLPGLDIVWIEAN